MAGLALHFQELCTTCQYRNRDTGYTCLRPVKIVNIVQLSICFMKVSVCCNIQIFEGLLGFVLSDLHAQLFIPIDSGLRKTNGVTITNFYTAHWHLSIATHGTTLHHFFHLLSRCVFGRFIWQLYERASFCY